MTQFRSMRRLAVLEGIKILEKWLGQLGFRYIGHTLGNGLVTSKFRNEVQYLEIVTQDGCVVEWGMYDNDLYCDSVPCDGVLEAFNGICDFVWGLDLPDDLWYSGEDIRRILQKLLHRGHTPKLWFEQGGLIIFPVGNQELAIGDGPEVSTLGQEYDNLILAAQAILENGNHESD